MSVPNEKIDYDPRVDQYVCGKMSEDEELAFEVEFLENPALLDEVEIATKLKQGLAMNRDYQPEPAAATDKRSGNVLQFVRKELFNWQAAYGAVAASLFLIPTAILVLSQQGAVIDQPLTAQTTSLTQGTYVHVLGQRVRSSVKPKEVVYVEPNQPSLVLGFTSEPTFGAPDAVTVTVFNDQEQQLWQSQSLYPDHRWAVYVNVDGSLLAPGKYTYQLANAENTVTSKGEFFVEASE